jgi:SAM-dependent methyltransferase
VWTIPTEPLRVPDHIGVDHFAAFPSEFPRRLILGWSPSGVCVACGEGRRPVVDRTPMPRDEWGHRSPDSAHGEIGKPAWSGQEVNRFKAANPDTITGYACACPDTTAPTRPAVVLDPFCGTGTVPAVANHLGRHGVGIDLSADYLRLAEWRCNDPALRAKVLRVDKPRAVVDGQLDIFGGAA